MRHYTAVTAHASERGAPFLRLHYRNFNGIVYDMLYPNDPGYNPDLAKALLALQDATIHYYEENKK